MMSYRSLTQLPEPTYLTTWRASLIRPIARTNLVTNPSAETATTNYTAQGGSIARSTTESFHGAYSIAVTPTAATTDGVYYGTVSLTSGTTYAASVKIKVPNAAGRPYRLAFATTAGVVLQSKTFTATGLWQWVTLLYTETSTTTRRIYITKNGGTETAIFYIDGLQVEACESGNWFATTYIDGDQQGLLGALESTPAYYWTGTPHASTSVRSAQTRAGGQLVNLANYGFLLTAIIGLGMAPVEPVITPFGQLDGAQFLDQRNASRSFVLNGRWQAPTSRAQDRQMAALQADIGRDAIATRQPMTLAFEPLENDRALRAPVMVPGVSYVGGLEGAIDGLPTADTPIAFTQYIPLIVDSEDGVALSVQGSVAEADFILERTNAGAWQALSTGMNAGSSVFALQYGNDGSLYAGGSFTSAGASGADYIAVWNGTAWAALASDTALNGNVIALTKGANGTIYVGGVFTNAGGVANGDRIATWDGSAWGALSTGANDGVYALAFAPNGTLYAAGIFTTIGGTAADQIASWNGSAWTALAAPASTNNNIYALTVGLDGTLYAGGDFTLIGGVALTSIAMWNGTTWVSMGNANNTVEALTTGPDGSIYATGSFTTIGGVSANRIARWNGQSWSPLGGGLGSTTGYALTINPLDGTLYAGGTFTTAGGVSLPDRFAIWNGSAWVIPDVDLPASASIRAMTFRGDGNFVVGGDFTGTATAAALTTATNAGTVVAYPRLILNGPSSGTARVFSLTNTATGQRIFFNLTMQVGEQVVINFDPANISAISTFQGNVLGSILPGSDLTDFGLQPGANNISLLIGSSTATATLVWTTASGSLADGWTR